ncbi:hypothetical protein LTR67_000717 [Exophiala xenobiotica]
MSFARFFQKSNSGLSTSGTTSFYFQRANTSMPYEKYTSTNQYNNLSGESYRVQAADRPTVHQVFRVRLKATQEYFVIDLSNAQFGFFDTVIPWEKYLLDRVSEVRTIDPLGTFDSVALGGRSMKSVRELDLKTFTAVRLEQLFESWLCDNHLTTTDLIAMKGTPFADNCAELEQHLSNGLNQTWKQTEQFCDLAWELRRNAALHSNHHELGEFLKKAGLWDRFRSPNNNRWFQSVLPGLITLPSPTSSGSFTVVR